MKISIVPFDPDDLLEIAKVDLECFGSEEAYPVSFFRQAFDIFGNFLYVAKTDEKQIIGYLIGAINPETCQGWIVAIGVLPLFQKMDVGRCLIQTYIDRLVKMNIQSLLLTVSPENRPAIGLYNKLGFSSGEILKDYFGPGNPKIIFKKTLLE